MCTYSYSKIMGWLRARVLDIAGQQLNGSSPSVFAHKQAIEMLPQGPDDQLVHHSFENSVQVQEFICLQLKEYKDIVIRLCKHKTNNAQNISGTNVTIRYFMKLNLIFRFP